MKTEVMPTMIVHSETCTGCHMCVLMCSLSRTGGYSASRARLAVVKRATSEDGVRKDVPLICRQCVDAPCAAACPTNAIVRDIATSAVLVTQEACTLCELCVGACPYDAIFVQGNELVICDLCGGKPVCVQYCSYGTLEYPLE